MNLRFWKKQMTPIHDNHQEHVEVKQELEAHRTKMEQDAKRLRWLEIEAGIYKPSPIRRDEH